MVASSFTGSSPSPIWGNGDRINKNDATVCDRMDLLNQRHARLIGSTALLAGGAVCGGVLGSSVASVVAGIIANDVIPQHMENLTVRLRDSRGQLHNHDLAEAVGLAIALLIKARAEAGTYPASQKGMVSLAEYTVRHWKTIAQELKTVYPEKFAKIEDSQVPGLFSQALGNEPGQVLTEADWLELLQEVRGKANLELPQHVLQELARNLRDNFAFALREVLKADCSEGGKAFGGLVISLLGAIHNGLQQVQVPQESREDVNRVLAELEKVEQELAGIKAENQARFQALSTQLGLGIEVILGEIDRTQEILDSLREWLGDELRQIGKTLAEIEKTTGEIKDISLGNSGKLDELIDRVGTFTPTSQPESTSSVVGDALPQINHWQGRAQELATIHGWLDDENRKLGIIVGIAGMGKTSLAVKVYREREDFTRKYWAELGERPRFAILARQVLQQLVGIDRDIIEKMPDAQLSAMLVQELQRQRFLLVLDNFESVVGDEDYLEFLQRWLGSCHQTEILVTTQVEPRLSWGEKPQILPLKRGLSNSEGAQLLAARGVEEPLEEREQFSQKVSGHPLTLNLAAGMLSTQRGEERITLAELTTDISEAMQQLAGRHRQENHVQLLVVLDRCFGWLSPVWQERLLRLTVLRQGFNRPLVEAMVGEGIGDEELPNLGIQGFLVALAKKDRQERQRYEFQPFILEYLHCRAGEVKEAHQRAVEVYRSRCEMPQEWNRATVEDVQDYLELFYHLCQLGEYVQAFDAIYNHLGSHKKSVDKFLEVRGYNSLRVELYLQLIPHLPNRQNWRYTASLTSLGIAYYAQGDYEAALSFHQQSLEIEQQIGDRSGIASSLGNLGNAYSSQGDYKAALSFYQQSLKISQEIGDRSGIANSFTGLGIAYRSQGDYKSAISFHQQSLEISQEIGDRSGIASSLGNLGNAYRSQGDYERAISFYQQSLEIKQESGDRSGIATSFNNLGIAYGSQGDCERAISFHQQSLEIAQEIGDRSGIAASLGNLGNAYDSQGDYESAISFHQQSLEIKQQIGDRSGIAASLGNLGNAYYSQGDYESAISFYQQSLEIQQQIGDRSGIANSFNNLGLAYYSQGDYQRAISFYQQSLEIQQQIGDRSGIAYSFMGLGNAYKSQGEYERAISFHQQSLEIQQQIGNVAGEGVLRGNLGELLIQLERYSEAEESLQTALTLATRVNDLPNQAHVHYNLAVLYQKLGNLDRARSHCQQALALATQLGIPLVEECQRLNEQLTMNN
ncbi:tetratricopeptide repeat protein [Roseofilum sp. BLCC_M91]|uniref:Tetratricopeptide repeat protein n=1 Tax=Roseofilum halophilum BLCC-M91 TaxID=3022259 RepID=A0ABT7BDX0_9CYAN|nr:tetratricopeptide repeat protein [Roseofilum halophilum]MDJ1177388.1 tetratricopeptide repeat protein [Roseofilum halophilum BLCC-M91]